MFPYLAGASFMLIVLGCAYFIFVKANKNKEDRSKAKEDALGEGQHQGVVNGTGHAAPATSRKSRLVTTLLALLLGQIGGHRFYLGKTGTGLVMLALTVFAYAMLIHSNSVPSVARAYPDGHLESVPEYNYSIYFQLGLVWLWTIVDLITAARGKFLDARGRPVTGW